MWQLAHKDFKAVSLSVSACNAGDLGSIPGSGRSSGEGNGNPLQYSCLENPMDREAWQAIFHGIARGGYDLVIKPPPPWFNSWVGKIWWRRGRLPTPAFLGFPCGLAGKESACKAGDLGLIPGLRRTPGEGKNPWRRERLPISVFWPKEFHGLYSPRGHRESDMTKQLSLHSLHLKYNN